MNWAAISVTVGLVGLALSIMPYGIAILALLAWLWWLG